MLKAFGPHSKISFQSFSTWVVGLVTQGLLVKAGTKMFKKNKGWDDMMSGRLFVPELPPRVVKGRWV